MVPMSPENIPPDFWEVCGFWELLGGERVALDRVDPRDLPNPDRLRGILIYKLWLAGT